MNTPESRRAVTPHHLTMGDAVCLIAGFALAFALWPLRDESSYERDSAYHPFLFEPFRSVLRALPLIPVVLTPLLLGRRFRLRDRIRPAEWLILLFSVYRIRPALIYLEDVFYWYLLGRTGGYFEIGGILIRWSIPGIASVFMFMGFGILIAVRRKIGPGLESLALFLLLALALWEPIPGVVAELQTRLHAIRNQWEIPWDSTMGGLIWELNDFPYDVIVLTCLLLDLRPHDSRLTESMGRVLFGISLFPMLLNESFYLFQHRKMDWAYLGIIFSRYTSRIMILIIALLISWCVTRWFTLRQNQHAKELSKMT